MAEKEKKKKIYQLAKEINLASDSLIAFLNKKGFDVKTINSIVTEEMNSLIMSHFKKEKEIAEKHHRKIQSLQGITKKVEKKVEKEPEIKITRKVKKLKDEKQKEEAVEEVIEQITEEKPISKPSIEEKPAAVETEEIPSEEIAEEVTLKEETTVEDKSKITEVEEVIEPEKEIEEEISDEAVVEEIPSVTKESSEIKKEKEVKDKKVSKRLTPKMGLRIKGKMDLEIKKDSLPEIVEKEIVKESAQEIGKKKKKKKKKKIKEPGKLASASDVDELEIKKKKKKKVRHVEIDREEVETAIKRTIAEMEESVLGARALLRRKKKKEREEAELKHQIELEKDKSKLKVTEYVSVNELAKLMQTDVAEVIKKCIELGLMVSINQRLDKDTITLVSAEFGFEVEFMTEFDEKTFEEKEEDSEEMLEPRPPVVTIMGHVDHGKTSLLDYIRRTNVVAGESGGITQHIGAYSVVLDSKKSITFLDTPGHEAFTAMRARGAQLTDIVVLVVAADDAVMPQTVEAISHAQAANVPMIVAINKIDKQNSNTERIRQQLSEKNILVEEWGGRYQSVEISAKTGHNVDLLLEKILLEAEILNLRANPKTKARGTIIEAQLDKGKGIITTVLVKKGTLKIGDAFIAGFSCGRVRAMLDERGHRIEYAKPSTPVQVLGFDGIPQAGDTLAVMDSEREAREISLRRQQLKREQDFREIRTITLDNFSKKVQEGTIKELKVIVKGDVDGSIGAISDSLMKIVNPEVRVNVIHKGVGAISEGDVLLAAASHAIIIGFHVRPNLNARFLAETEKVEIRFYNIIYEVIEDVKKALEGMLAPEKKEEILGAIEVRETFKIPKIGTIAGCYVQNGKITRNNRIRLLRDGIVIFEGTISSLKRFKEDVREVDSGYECGIGLEGFNDLKVNDIIEPYKIIELKRKLT